MSQEITLHTVRKEALKAIEQLRNKEIDHKTALEIRNLLNVVIDTAKVEIEFVRVIPNSLKEKMTKSELRQLVSSSENKDHDLDEKLAKLKAENPINEVQRPDVSRIIT